MGTLRSELQKLQVETKSGSKSKEMAGKEVEALKWVFVCMMSA